MRVQILQFRILNLNMSEFLLSKHKTAQSTNQVQCNVGAFSVAHIVQIRITVF